MRVYTPARFAAGALALLVALAPSVRAEGWGTIKGQVVWEGGAVPKREPIKVDKDQASCLKKGALLSEKYVVNPKNKGMRWVMVWLTDAKDPKKPLPVHPGMKTITQKTVTMDQPCCMFEPHVLGVRQGQTLVVKNSADIPHNVNVQALFPNPSFNVLLPPGGSLPVSNLKASRSPIQIACNIHGWMKSYVRVFDGPYYAVTDENGHFEIKNAPAGDWHLVVWQEEKGWVAPPDNPNKAGMPVTVKAGEVTNLTIPFKPSKD